MNMFDGERVVKVYRDYVHEDRKVSELDHMELKDGYSIYRVAATYAKSLPASDYYVVAKDDKQARKIFTSRFSWLDYIKSIDKVEEDVCFYILNNPSQYITIY
jgi:hypothetical protein